MEISHPAAGHLVKMIDGNRFRSDSLLIAAFNGFFVYPMDSGGCQTIVAPYVGRVGHTLELVVATAAIEHLSSSIHGHNDPHKGLTHIHLDGLALSVEERRGRATTIRAQQGNPDEPDFSWIPDIQTMFCGVKLDPNVTRSRAIRFEFALCDGVIGAVPGEKTYTEQWSWTTCDLASHTQRITSNTAHLAAAPEQLTLRFATLSGHHRGRLVLRALPLPVVGIAVHWLTFANTPPPLGDYSAEVELGHVEALLKLSRAHDTITIPRKQRVECKQLSAPAVNIEGSFLELFLHYMATSNRFNGTPECSGEQGALA